MMQRIVVLLAAIALATVGSTGSQVFAAYPGQNGRIAFVSLRGSGQAAQWDIFTIKQDGTGRRRLTNNAVNDDDPVYSPDGAMIAFEREVGGLDEELFTMRADGSQVRRLTNNDCRDANPTWSPNMARIAYDSDCPDSDGRDIWKIRLLTGVTNQVTNLPGNQIHPAWSVQNEIAFEDHSLVNPDIWRMDANGSDRVQLTDSAFADQDPAWSPNGARIAFERLNNDTVRFEVWRMRRDGNQEERISQGNQNDGQPAWSPNNLRIAFARSPADDIGALSIFTMVAAGGAGTEVTDDGQVNQKPDWQPV